MSCSLKNRRRLKLKKGVTMNREILFRGKRIDNGEWIQGSLVTGAFVKSDTGQDIPYIFNTDECSNADCFEDFTDDYGYYEVYPATVGQFTGLTDKNGVKIFEGDIVKATTDKHMVIGWSKRFASYIIDRDGWAFSHWFGESMEAHEVKVIGNIHDNPELIK